MPCTAGTDVNLERAPPRRGARGRTKPRVQTTRPTESERSEFFRSFPERVQKRGLKDGLGPQGAEAAVSYVYQAGRPWNKWQSLEAGLHIAYRRGVGAWRQKEVQAYGPELPTEAVEVPDDHPLADVERITGVWAATPLDDALEQLSEPDRRAITLYYQENLSYVEIGLVLHVGTAAARQRVCRAISKLRRLLGVPEGQGDALAIH